MADFKTAYLITMFNEGGYNRGVGENETFFGIDRGMNPKWSGWPVVDHYRKENPQLSDKQLNVLFRADAGLMGSKDLFYKRAYWDVVKLDQINDQQIANNLFDCSVNPCIDTVQEVLQKGCNVVKPGSLKVDGAVGPATIAVANSCEPELLMIAINRIRSDNYHERVIRTPLMAQWLNGWLKRLLPYKK